MLNGDSIYCDCCGTELMAKVVGDRLVIRDRRHGSNHVAVVPLKDILDKLGISLYSMAMMTNEGPEASGLGNHSE